MVLEKRADADSRFGSRSERSEREEGPGMDLNHQNPPKGLAWQAAVLADPDKRMKTEVRLQGHALWLVRALWLLIVACELFYLVNNLAAAFVLYHTACADSAKMSCAKVLQLSVTRLPALAQYGWSLDGYALYALVCDLIQIVFYLGLGALIFWRSSDRRISLFASLWLITFAVVGIEYVPLPGLLGFLGGTLQLLAWFGLALLFAIFPDGRFVPRWAWILPTLFVSLVGYTLTPLSPPDSATSIWFGAAGYGIFAITVGMQVYRYRAAASPMERQQIKWFASGFAAFVLGVVAQNLLPLVIPALSQPDSWYPLANPAAWTLIFVLIPVGIGIALLRSRLWDIDAIINKALVYGLLSVLLATVYAGLVLGLQVLLGGLLHQTNAIALV